MKKNYSNINGQFKERVASFDYSAKWVKDKELLALHNKLAFVHAGDLVLEVCCGTGIVGESLSKLGAKVFGLDISLFMLEKARARLCSCVNACAEEIPFSDNTFNAVICRQAFHFLDTPKVIKEMLRVAKPNTGRIIISQIVPFNERDRDWLFKIHAKKQPLLKNFPQAAELEDLLKDNSCLDISISEHFVEEPINDWLKDTFFTPDKILEIKKMFLEAPVSYRKLHKTKVVGDDVVDTMRWVILRGRKP